jgi:L-fuculose-phosphate aldolase
LATAVAQTLQNSPAVLLQNHGVVVTGESVSQALLRLNLLEEQAKIYLAALAAGEPRQLSEDDKRKLDELFSRNHYRAA